MIRKTVVPFRFFLVLSLACGAIPGTLSAGELAGVTLPDTLEVSGATLQLNGMALRSKAIFKVYVAGLYLPEAQSSWQKVLADDSSRVLEMRWLRSVSKEKICEGWTDGLAANTPNAGADLVEAFETLCDAMDDARTGDSFRFEYTPESGTTIQVKGKTRGTISGKAFADALFACWIGAEPGPGEDFRAGLMGAE